MPVQMLIGLVMLMEEIQEIVFYLYCKHVLLSHLLKRGYVALTECARTLIWCRS
jgi:hypothetical protein